MSIAGAICLCVGRADVRCDDGHCDIAGPGAPADRDSCRICWLRLQPLTQQPLPSRPLPLRGPCRHRGDETGEQLCSSCQGSVRIKTFACAIHGQTTLAKALPGTACCQTCPEHVLAERILDVNPPRPWGMGDRTAFNCGLADHEGRHWFVYRCGWTGSRVVLCELDASHHPIGPAFLLEGKGIAEDAQTREDPRLFVHRGRLHVAYTGISPRWLDPKEDRNRGRIQQCVLRAGSDLSSPRVELAWYPNYPKHTIVEKNWSFFSHEDVLYAVYSISPHLVLRIGDPVRNYLGVRSVAEPVAEPYHWNLPVGLGGEPAREPLGDRSPSQAGSQGCAARGGASPVRVGDEYWSWYHGRREGGPDTEYWVALYTFEARPPFRPRRYVPFPLLEPRKAERPSHRATHVVFPGGAVLRDGKWFIACGYYDHRCLVAEFDHARVESWLVPAK